MNERRAIWGAGMGLVVTVAVIGGFVIDRASNSLAHTMTFNTGVPTRFSPQPSAFCNTLHQSRGLHEMVDDAGIGFTGTSSAQHANLFMLKVVVITSPEQATRTAMVDLYRDVLRGDSQSNAAQQAINTVEVMNPCARYP